MPEIVLVCLSWVTRDVIAQKNFSGICLLGNPLKLAQLEYLLSNSTDW